MLFLCVLRCQCREGICLQMKFLFLALLHFGGFLGQISAERRRNVRRQDSLFINNEEAEYLVALTNEHVDDTKLCRPEYHARKPRRCHPQIASSSSSKSDDTYFEDSGLSNEFFRCCTSPANGMEDVNWIEDMDFYHTYPVLNGPGPTWSYFRLGDFVANGGELVTGCHGGMLDTSMYRVTESGTPIPELDHLKYLIFANKRAEVPRRGQLVVEWKAMAKTIRTDENPFGPRLTHDNDPRLASAAFIVSDFNTGLAFNFLLTNDRVYVMYTRQPYLRFVFDRQYAAFTYIIPVKMRSCEDAHRLRVTLDGARREIKWYVDYRLVFRLTTVGGRLARPLYKTGEYGGFNELAFPTAIEYGFGSMTLLDQYPVCYRSEKNTECWYPSSVQALVKLGDSLALPQYNPFLGHPHPASYWDEQARPVSRLWGQGSESRIFRLSVYQVFSPDIGAECPVYSPSYSLCSDLCLQKISC